MRKRFRLYPAEGYMGVSIYGDHYEIDGDQFVIYDDRNWIVGICGLEALSGVQNEKNQWVYKALGTITID